MLTVSPLPSEAGRGYEENQGVKCLTAGCSLKSIRGGRLCPVWGWLGVQWVNSSSSSLGTRCEHLAWFSFMDRQSYSPTALQSLATHSHRFKRAGKLWRKYSGYSVVVSIYAVTP